MNKKALVAFLAVIILAGGGYFIWLQRTPQIPSPPPIQEVIDTPQRQAEKTTIASSRANPIESGVISPQQNRIAPIGKLYSNKKLGFSFQYPSTWFQNGREEEAVNLSGATMSITVNFSDSVSSSTLSVEYHLAPKGAELYRYAVSQFKDSKGWYATGGKQIDVAGNKAIEANTKIDKDGRGKTLSPALRLIVVDFLDKAQTGEIEMQFKTPIPDDVEVAKFRELLAGFKFQ